MRVVVCVKYVPVLAKLHFDPATRRLVRAGVPGEPSAFDVRALVHALRLRDQHGGEVVVLSMGPPEARDGIVECLALGADRGVHLCDAALAGSDTLATARALAAVLRREAPDLVLCGRVSVDAETGQVGPELAELLDLPQATSVHRLDVDPDEGTFRAERETDEGFETIEGPLPAVITAAEDLAEERFPSKAEREAAARRPIETVGVADAGIAPADVGEAGSPTWVAGVEEVPSERRGEILAADSPEAAARALRDWLAAHGATRDVAAPPLPPPANGAGAPIWVVVEANARGLQQVTVELLANSRPTPPTRMPPSSPTPSARAPRGSCCWVPRFAAAIWRRGLPRGSASASPAMPSTSSSTPRVACGR
jgi:electron transfer flavoprotein alpha/beta subunit